MFRHKGKRRAFIHDLRLASMLSFIAGIVNVCGVLAVKVLTTNVTGHFAYFAEELSKKAFRSAFIFLVFIFFFLFGAFISNALIELLARLKSKISHALPMIIEIIILVAIGVFADYYNWTNLFGNMIACALLFAMGMQNALVTKISKATVRTTHLTGLFTDLGIELSQLFFYKHQIEQQQLTRSIFLRLIIIIFFFLGCVLGGFLFGIFALRTLLLAAACLIIALFYDLLRYKFYAIKRKLIL